MDRNFILKKKIITDPITYEPVIGIKILNQVLEDYGLPSLDQLELNGYGVNARDHPYGYWIYIEVWI